MPNHPNADLYQRPVELLQALLRFETINPPGDERLIMEYIRDVLAAAGIKGQLLGKDPQRPNLVARLEGRGDASPLLLYGHADVVTVENQDWEHPPFEGKIVDDYLWGRGTIDMKGGLAMFIAAFIRAKIENLPLAGDLILAVVCDEESMGDYGADYLVEQYPEHFEGVRYALGEVGGFSMYIGDQCFYPIMVAEKQVCWMRATLRGPGGHGSVPVQGGAMAQLGRLLTRLDQRQLPVHITPAAQLMFDAIAKGLGGFQGALLSQICNPRLTNALLKLLGDNGQLYAPLFHNTVSPTGLQASSKTNVIPSQVQVELDGRLLPGFGPPDLIAELQQIVGPQVEFEIINYQPGPSEPDMGLYETLAGILRQADPQAIPVPLFLSGTTDARAFTRLGIQTYGFIPMQLPPELKFSTLFHGANERIPVAALDFGTNAVYEVLKRYGA